MESTNSSVGYLQSRESQVGSTTRRRGSSISSTRPPLRQSQSSTKDPLGTPSLPPKPPPSRSASVTEPCCVCARIGRNYTCVQCNGDFCDECWAAQFPHKNGRVGIDGLPHEKTDRHVVDRLKQILEPIRTAEQQQNMHKSDEETTWFGIARDASNMPIFQDYGRYATIMAESQSARNPRYPQLVSFIGQTAAGKSTLIKMLIDSQLSNETLDTDRPPFPSPVTGTINDNLPTSGDVHLYSDPASYSSPLPMLYADCEGLDGGENIPRASRAKPEKKHKKNGQSSKRALAWAKTEETQKRGYAVAQLYPRLLYIFSDVVVFVLRNSKTFESIVLEKLLDWASASIEKSLNQPALPHAIIVINASEISSGTTQWDVEEATRILMSDISGAIQRVPRFHECARYWRERGKKINSTRDLLECYYSSIRVVRIPTRGRYMLMDEQISKLHHEIKMCCQLSYSTKKRVRMLASGDKLQIYLQSAFDHFSKNLDSPFDFVKEAIKINPISRDFPGNILKLAIAIKDCNVNFSAPRIFKELSLMVASCIMLDAARRSLPGLAKQLLNEHYLDHCDDALNDFCDLYWPCSFRNIRGQCSLVKSGHHTKTHQNADGKIIGTGEYESNFSAEEYAEEWSDDLERNVNDIQRIIQDLMFHNTNLMEIEASLKVHRDGLNDFYSTVGYAGSYISHSTCFSCLRELPEHPLPCGHVLCTLCIKSYGQQISKTLLEISECPLHAHEARFAEPWLIRMFPPHAGVRILNLDGGGVRGIVELEVLAAIERQLGGNLHIQNFFDLIVGTSTGGIIALGLGVQGWSVNECIDRFKKLCGKAFSPRAFHNVWGLEQITTAVHKSKYRTKPFEEALRGAFGDNALFGGRTEQDRFMLKVAITATSSVEQQAVLLTNYNRPEPSISTTYRFERLDNPKLELKVWEAARATSAAPPYFKVFRQQESQRGYLDGALYHNNPVHVSHNEHKLLWPALDSQSSKPPDILLSVGTGHCGPDAEQDICEPGQRWRILGKPSHAENDPISTNRKKILRKFPTFTEDMWNVVSSRFQHLLNCNHIWDQFRQDTLDPYSRDRCRYLRINPDLRTDVPRMDDISALEGMQRTVLEQMRNNSKVKEVAHRLVASTFFFEKGEVKGSQIIGSVYCRFADSSDEMKALGQFLSKCHRTKFTPNFVIREAENREAIQIIPISTQCIESMCLRGFFEIGTIKIDLSRQMSSSTIAICLQENPYPHSSSSELPISGFPRQFLMEDDMQRIPPRGLTSCSSGSLARRPHRRLARHTRRPPGEGNQPQLRRRKSQPDLRPIEMFADGAGPQSSYPEHPGDVLRWSIARSKSTDCRPESLISPNRPENQHVPVTTFELDGTELSGGSRHLSV